MPIAQTPAEKKRLRNALDQLARLYRDRADPDTAKRVPASNRVGMAKALFPYDLLTDDEARELKTALHQCDNVGEPTKKLRGDDGKMYAVPNGNWVTLDTIAKNAPAVVAVCERIVKNVHTSTPSRATIEVADDDSTVTVNGKVCQLRGTHDADFIRALLKKRGMSIPASTLTAMTGARANRIYKQLPAPLTKVMLRPRRGSREGYCIP